MKVTLITVSYNSQETLKDTIDSVKNQTYDNIEYILVDGRSIDETINIIRYYEKTFKESKKEYRWISEKDEGIYDAINKGIKMASGDIIGILNSDDYFYDDNVIKDVVGEFETKNIDCLYGNMIYVDPNSKKIVRRWVSKEFKQGLFEKSWTPGHPSFYCKKEFFEKYGLYKVDYKIAADVELMYRFLDKNNLKSIYYDRYMVTMRQGGISSSGLKSTITITKEMRKAIRANGGKFNLIKYLFYKSLKCKEFLIK